MALGTTNISLNTVKSTIGGSTYSLFTNCTFDKATPGAANGINKWSRYKPIRDAGLGAYWPQDTFGMYGLNVKYGGTIIDGTKAFWAYLAPRGGSPGGSPDEPGRLGDFRGYEHDPDIAGPVIYCLTSDVVFAHGTTLTPSLTPSYSTGHWWVKCNQAPHNSVKILPSDLGYTSANYRIGVHLNIGTLHFYKTGALVSSIGVGGQDVYFDANLTDLSSKAMTDFPSTDVGTYTWNLYLSPTQDTTWRQSSSQPSNYIELPGGGSETWGSKTIQSTGTFTMGPWLIAGNTSDTTTNVTQLTWAYNSNAVQKIRLWRPNGSAHSGPNTIPSHWSIPLAEQGGVGGNSVTANYNAWDDGTAISIQPTGVNNGAEINQDIIFGLEISHPNTFGTECTIHLKHEDGTPPSVYAFSSSDYTLASTSVNSGLSIGSTTLNITWGTVPNTISGSNIPVKVYDNPGLTHLIGNTTMNKISNNNVTGDVTVSALTPGQILYINIGASS